LRPQPGPVSTPESRQAQRSYASVSAAQHHWTSGVTVTRLNLAANALAPALGGGNFTTDHPKPLVVQNGLDR
jgi:hypothetical protein